MVLYLAERLARELMRKHDIESWRFEFDNAKRRFGQCNYTDKVISISRHLVLLNDEKEVRNVILHEIAHALCPGENHNDKWREKAISIGCDGNRCYKDDYVETPEAKYVAYCNNGHKFTRMKSTKNRYICSKCKKENGDTTILVYKENPLYINPLKNNVIRFLRK